MDRFSTADINDQSGRIAVVTGASSGLGLETSAALAAHGAKVVMASRSTERLRTAASEIRRRHPGAELTTVALDLASLESVRNAAATIRALHDRLDLLVDNAGVMAIPRAETVDGFEMQFGTNHLGHFALTGLLLPAMVTVVGSRVVAVTSQVRHIGRIDFADLHGRRRYGRWKAYAQSKLANVLFIEELERRLRAAGAATIAVAAHPGYAATNLQAGSSFLQHHSYRLANMTFAQSAAAGALPTLYAAAAPGVAGGELFGPDKLGGMRGAPRRARLEAKALDPEVARRLWEASVDQTGVDYAVLAGS